MLFFAFGTLAPHLELTGIAVLLGLLSAPRLLTPALIKPITEADDIVYLHTAPFAPWRPTGILFLTPIDANDRGSLAFDRLHNTPRFSPEGFANHERAIRIV
jgi:hypothetical protein